MCVCVCVCVKCDPFSGPFCQKGCPLAKVGAFPGLKHNSGGMSEASPAFLTKGCDLVVHYSSTAPAPKKKPSNSIYFRTKLKTNSFHVHHYRGRSWAFWSGGACVRTLRTPWRRPCIFKDLKGNETHIPFCIQ